MELFFIAECDLQEWNSDKDNNVLCNTKSFLMLVIPDLIGNPELNLDKLFWIPASAGMTEKNR
jgi:hypothetical protein